MKYLLGVILLVSLSSHAQITINWQVKTSLPSFPRGDYGAFLIDSNYYVVGGIDSIEAPTSQVWRYTITTDLWHRMNDYPGGRISSNQCFAIDNKGYLLIGKDSISSYACDDEFWEYNPQGDSWTHKANFPGGKREGATSFSHDGKGYLAFGIACGVAYKNDLWEYSPISNTWILIPDTLPSLGRYGCINAQYDSSVYFVAGYPDLLNNSRLKDVWKYNVVSSSWDSLTLLPGVGRDLCVVYAFKDFLLAGYGADQNGNNLSDCKIYNYAAKTWAVVTANNFPHSVWNNQNGCFIYKRKAYFFGGGKGPLSFYNNVWSFDATPYFPINTVGISDVAEDTHLRVYPNPISSHGTLTISAPERGVVGFYDAIGQLVYTTPLASGVNSINGELLRSTGVLFYTATLSSGRTEQGKVVIVK